MMITREVSADRSTGLPLSAEVPVKTLRCCGSNPSGPPAEPFGKERMARMNVSSEIVGQQLSSLGGMAFGSLDGVGGASA